MRQAIVTKFIAPTNTKGPRVKAWCNAGKLTMPWIDSLNIEENHRFVAVQLWGKLKWHTKNIYLIGGALPGDAGYCFVQKEFPALHS